MSPVGYNRALYPIATIYAMRILQNYAGIRSQPEEPWDALIDKPMGKYAKLLQHILSGRSDANIGFEDLRHVLLRVGFSERIRGDHHIFTREGVEEILNLQPKGAMAKPYQVKQVRTVLVRYKLGVEDAE